MHPIWGSFLSLSHFPICLLELSGVTSQYISILNPGFRVRFCGNQRKLRSGKVRHLAKSLTARTRQSQRVESCSPQTLWYNGRNRYSENYNIRQREMKGQIDVQTNARGTFKNTKKQTNKNPQQPSPTTKCHGESGTAE